MTMTSLIGFPATKIIIPNCTAEQWFGIKNEISDYLEKSEAEVSTPNYDVYQDNTGCISIIIMESHDMYKMHILEILNEKNVRWETRLVKVSRPIASWNKNRE